MVIPSHVCTTFCWPSIPRGTLGLLPQFSSYEQCCCGYEGADTSSKHGFQSCVNSRRQPEVELLGHRVILFLIVWVSPSGNTTSIPTGCERIPTDLHPHQHLFSVILTQPHDRRQVALLRISALGHLFLWLLTVCFFSLEECLFKSFAFFLIISF